MKPDLSLILPCYNEANHLEINVSRIITVLNESRLSYEIILIDDKSRDRTKEIIKNLSKKFGSIRYWFHSKNLGRGGTVTEGFKKAKGDVVGFIDVDLEVKPDHIPYFVELIKTRKYDCVVGYRYYPFRLLPVQYFLRTISSLAYSFIIQQLLHLPVKDTETGYKFFRRDKVLPVLKQTHNKHWFWDTEIIVKSYFNNLKIHEEPVLYLRNKNKKSTVKLIPDIIAHIRALVNLKLSLYKKSSTLGILYNFPALYGIFMRMIYGRNYKLRYANIAKFIKPEQSVVDVCCGDCVLYSYLKKKNVKYLGLDISPAFISYALKKNINASLFDLRTDEIPHADYIILQGSLYQFKNPEKILKKLLLASKKSLIIAETIQTLANNSRLGKTFLKHIGSLIVNTENSDTPRFDSVSFKKVTSPFNPRYIENKKEIIAIIQKN